MRPALAMLLGGLLMFLLLVGLSLRPVPGEMQVKDGKRTVRLKRACPCDSLKGKAVRFRIG